MWCSSDLWRRSKMRSDPVKKTLAAWHALPAEDVLRRLGSRSEGLSNEEAKKRLASHGPNRLTPPKRRSALHRLAAQFHNVLIYVLLTSAVITALLQHWLDAGVIAGVVVINALIGFLQEGKAEEAIEAIRNILSPQATVVRDGRRMTLSAVDVVPGDVVALQSGDKVPADLRLFRTKNFRIEEAALTGESVPAEKSTQPIKEEAIVGDRSCMAFSGTLVTYGQGMGVVAATADDTEIGLISGLLAQIQPLTTRLLQKMSEFGRFLTIAIVLLAVGTLGFGTLVRGNTVSDMFMASVGLAVAAIPEGLPAIVTITLAIGVQRMARRNAIIRRLPAVETLGSVTTICTDKTGTLTRNEMTGKTIATVSDLLEVTGVGYEPTGVFLVGGNEIALADYPDILELARAGMLCNEASIFSENNRWELHGDPTEGALVSLAMKAGLELVTERQRLSTIDTVPFESENRFMASLHAQDETGSVIYVKGAPERILSMCSYQRRTGTDEPIDLALWQQLGDQIANRGQRTLAIARKQAPFTQETLNTTDVESGLTILGIVGLIDPPRGDATSAVRRCSRAGIRTKMVTGDHAATARAVGAEMGIGDGVRALTGEDIEALTPDELTEHVEAVDVFARVSPEHKLRLVKALQARGAIVAMTGDGVNDAPALKRADVGIAMGLKGTEVAKESAEMVLADDNFASIAAAVEEGRSVHDNIVKAILFILPTNAAEAATIVAAVLLGRMLPITPLQILWINMVTAVTLALSLSFEPPEQEVMRRPPRDPQAPLLSRFLLWRIVFVALLMVCGVFGVFLWARTHGGSVELARTLSINTLVMFEVFYLINTRYIRASVVNREGVFGNSYSIMAIAVVLLLQLLLTYTGPMQRLFETVAISGKSWSAIVILGLILFGLVELEKTLIRVWQKKG